MKSLGILLSGLFLVFLGCGGNNPIASANDQIVVRGYIYAGEPVNDIQITTTLPLGSEETGAPPVNDAQVSLIKNGQSVYQLVASAGDSGYYHYPGNDLSVNSGDEFEIRVEYKQYAATGKTVVPFPPQDVTISSHTLVIPTTFSWGAIGNDSTRTLYLHWKPDAASLFYVVVECIDENATPISTGNFPRNDLRRRFVFPPTNYNEFRITRGNVSHFGAHLAKVYRVNQEYADLYSSRNQDSRDLNEPLSNIKNGLGIFSAFASDSVFFKVVAQSDMK